MQKNNEKILYSASDIANFLECEHLTYLDRLHLDSPMEKTADSEDAIIIQKKGLAHEADYLARLKSTYKNVVDIIEVLGGRETKASNQDKAQATIEAMRAGADIIYQATFLENNLLGHADFLRKLDTPSALGSHSYEVIDTKLSGKSQAKFIIQLIFYSKLLANIQGIYPKSMYVVLGTNKEESFYCADYASYFDHLLDRFIKHTANHHQETYPNPCKKCDLCHWRERCDKQRLEDDHLSQVAGINKSQIAKLKIAGIHTMTALAELPEETLIAKINPLSLNTIRHQARLQHGYRETGEAKVELLEIDADSKRGFLRMPKADIGDLYFDMEGNPLEDGGKLEYLFGLYFLENGVAAFKGFWALTHAEEKKAFEEFMDFVMAHLARYPNAHIYHYASYEETAIKRLMSQYGTREHEVDHLLREGKLVDLYKVVKESIRTSEPKYSIKNIEHFYLEKRQGEVTNAGASIIYFENWKTTGDQKYLDDIEAYNEDDVRSTMELHKWLLTIRPSGLPWENATGQNLASDNEGGTTPASALREQQLDRYRRLLLGSAEIPENEKSEEYLVNELTFSLMDFHRREAKPAWWDFFQRAEKNIEELIEDADAIGGLELDPSIPNETVKRSIRYHFTYPAQETKLHSNSKPVIIGTGQTLSNFEIDPDNRKLSFTIGAKTELPERLAIGPGKPIESAILSTAIERYVDAKLSNNAAYQAISDLIARKHPRINGKSAGETIIPDGQTLLQGAIDAISNLNNSYLVVQGPPGTGKTYTGSNVIIALLKQGKRVGITSNSHKAINNLLLGVEKEANKSGFSFNGIKKSTGSDEELVDCKNITIADDNNIALSSEFNLVAGTAWLFARPEADQAFDYLFVDEAGQVALANIVAMGTAAHNIILLGDQMQLGQPTQGVHPGESGKSALDFLLQGHHTVTQDRGIFLGVSYRMNPAICKFISDAVYDSRLKSAPNTEKQVLELNQEALPQLRTHGLVYLSIEHHDCTQSSDEEAQLIVVLLNNLLSQHYVDKQGERHAMTLQDILVVTPYNLQVQKLKSVLPENARIGTVDKFQGQEAPVVIFSMVTSSGDDLPRDIEFLYSKNRLNVAISRAQALALFIANPKLMSVQCNSPEQMAMVNTLCQIGRFK